MNGKHRNKKNWPIPGLYKLTDFLPVSVAHEIYSSDLPSSSLMEVFLKEDRESNSPYEAPGSQSIHRHLSPYAPVIPSFKNNSWRSSSVGWLEDDKGFKDSELYEAFCKSMGEQEQFSSESACVRKLFSCSLVLPWTALGQFEGYYNYTLCLDLIQIYENDKGNFSQVLDALCLKFSPVSSGSPVILSGKETTYYMPSFYLPLAVPSSSVASRLELGLGSILEKRRSGSLSSLKKLSEDFQYLPYEDRPYYQLHYLKPSLLGKALENEVLSGEFMTYLDGLLDSVPEDMPASELSNLDSGYFCNVPKVLSIKQSLLQSENNRGFLYRVWDRSSFYLHQAELLEDSIETWSRIADYSCDTLRSLRDFLEKEPLKDGLPEADRPSDLKKDAEQLRGSLKSFKVLYGNVLGPALLMREAISLLQASPGSASSTSLVKEAFIASGPASNLGYSIRELIQSSSFKPFFPVEPEPGSEVILRKNFRKILEHEPTLLGELGEAYELLLGCYFTFTSPIVGADKTSGRFGFPDGSEEAFRKFREGRPWPWLEEASRYEL